MGDLGSIAGLGRSPGEGKRYPLQYFDLENSMSCIVHGVEKTQKGLGDFHFETLTDHRVKTLDTMTQDVGSLRKRVFSFALYILECL